MSQVPSSSLLVPLGSLVIFTASITVIMGFATVTSITVESPGWPVPPLHPELSETWAPPPWWKDKVGWGSWSRKAHNHYCPVPCSGWHHCVQEADVGHIASAAAATELSGGASTTAARGEGSKSHNTNALLPFSFAGAVVRGQSCGLSRHGRRTKVSSPVAAISPVSPPLCIPIHLPSDVQICGSLRHLSVSSRGSFLEL